MIKNIILLAVTCTLLPLSMFANTDSVSVNRDSTDVDEDFWFKFDKDLGFNRVKDFSFSFDSNERGVLEFSYGQMMTKHDNIMDNSFARIGSLHMKIGYFNDTVTGSRRYKLPYYDFEGLMCFTYNSVDIGGEKESGKIEGNTWQFEFADRDALGYDLGSGFAIMPYYQNSSLFWGGYDFSAIAPPEPLHRFTQGLRFGHGNEGGVMVQCTENISLTASYSFNTIFPRHVFWQWVVSEIVYQSADGLANGFVSLIKKRAAFAAPIVHFVLRNAISYGMYELRKKGMNWPFESEKALGVEQFRVGLTFMF